MVAANVDVAFVVCGLVDDLSPRRIERYLVLAWESGARPAVVLTKSDLCPDVSASLAEVELIALGVPVHVVSNVTGEGLEELRPYFAEDATVAALGSSGVGKSSLINRLAGNELQAVNEVRNDGRGRHTTTRRELIRVPGGGLFLDTPGMRELQLWEAEGGIEEAFEDVATLAARCRFSNCAHVTEPGCAVRAAIEDGSLELPGSRATASSNASSSDSSRSWTCARSPRRGRRGVASPAPCARSAGKGLFGESGEPSSQGGHELERVPGAGRADHERPVPLEHKALVCSRRVEAGLCTEGLVVGQREAASRPLGCQPDRSCVGLPFLSGSVTRPAWWRPTLSRPSPPSSA